jgi:hypothetical protein
MLLQAGLLMHGTRASGERDHANCMHINDNSNDRRIYLHEGPHHEFQALPSCCLAQKQPAHAIASRLSLRPAAAANHACRAARMRRFCSTCTNGKNPTTHAASATVGGLAQFA